MTNRNKAVIDLHSMSYEIYFSYPFYAETFIIDFSEKKNWFVSSFLINGCDPFCVEILGINHGNFVVWFYPFTSGQGKCFVVVFELPQFAGTVPSIKTTN